MSWALRPLCFSPALEQKLPIPFPSASLASLQSILQAVSRGHFWKAQSMPSVKLQLSGQHPKLSEWHKGSWCGHCPHPCPHLHPHSHFTSLNPLQLCLLINIYTSVAGPPLGWDTFLPLLLLANEIWTFKNQVKKFLFQETFPDDPPPPVWLRYIDAREHHVHTLFSALFILCAAFILLTWFLHVIFSLLKSGTNT